MDNQLEKLVNTYPQLFLTIQEAIFNAYRDSKNYAFKNGVNPFFTHRMGFVRHPTVEAAIIKSVEELHIPEIQLLCEHNSNRSAVHLEIHTPNGILVFASVQSPRSVPTKALYRQKYTEQCFIQEARPDLLPFTADCNPLYVVTHSPNQCAQQTDEIPAIVSIGRLSVDQRSWSCLHRFDQLNLNALTTEAIAETAGVTLKEEVAEKVLVTLKKA